MAIEKSKVIARFKSKFANVAISNQRLDAIAAKLASKLPDDSEDDAIDGELDFFNEAIPFSDLAKAEHREREAQRKQQTPEPATPQQNPSPQQTPDKQADEVPAWAKALLDSNKELATKLQTLESEKQQTTIQSRVKSLIGADVPESWLKGKALPTDPEQVEAWVSEEKNAYTAFVQENFNSSIGNNRPAFGAPGANKKAASKEEVDAVVAKMNIANL